MADMLATPQELASLLQQDLDLATATLVLELATAKVQRAAGGQRIVEATDTAVIDISPSAHDEYLQLPQMPVQSVDLVVLNGVTITDWTLTSQQLWRASGWALCGRPSQVKVTSTHGYPEDTPGLQLARDCTLSLARVAYGNPGAVLSQATDDYRVTYAEADARVQLSEHMAAAIADAYGTSAYVTSSR